MIRYRYLKVLNLSRFLKNIRQCRYIQDVANVVLLDLRDVLAVRGIAQKETGKNLDGFTAVRFQWIIGSAFTVGRFR